MNPTKKDVFWKNYPVKPSWKVCPAGPSILQAIKSDFRADIVYLSGITGHYKAFLWNENEKQWKKDEAMGIHVTVEVSLWGLKTSCC